MPKSRRKTALLGLSKVIAEENARFGIRCNTIAPGIVKTHFSEALWKDPNQEKAILKMVPLKRFGESEEIAGVAAFLCSDDSSYVTGESIVAAGGMVASRI
mmetsp:Transcript_6452/g.10204  ORF Transcript_6452/g.10204 Transcript_6452/m.10204 type:complete len:101 (+) Transcript_6452:81-383(+)